MSMAQGRDPRYKEDTVATRCSRDVLITPYLHNIAWHRDAWHIYTPLTSGVAVQLLV